MTNTSYNYENRDGVLPISWVRFHALCKGLAVAVSAYNPEVILGLGRGGLYLSKKKAR